jgi:hypothetical protein
VETGTSASRWALYATETFLYSKMSDIVLFEINHIRLKELQNHELCIEVDDYELWDFVQDYLWDNFQITEEHVEHSSANDSKLNRSYFAADVKSDDLIKALLQLDVQEVERIYRLNN